MATLTSSPSPPIIFSPWERIAIAPVLAESAVRFNVVATEVCEAAVNLPCASTVKDGMFVALPYEPADTAVLSSVWVIVLLPLEVVRPVPPIKLNISLLIIRASESFASSLKLNVCALLY